MKPSIRILMTGAAIALAMGRLPQSAGAGPLYLDLPREQQRFDRTLIVQTADLFDSLAVSLERRRGFALRFDAEARDLLLGRLAEGGEAGPHRDLRLLLDHAACGGAACGGDTILERLRADLLTMVRRNGRAGAPRGEALTTGGRISPNNVSLAICDSLRSSALPVKRGMTSLAWAHRDWRPRRARLARCLVLSVNLPAPWSARLWDRWRTPPIEGRACPLFTDRIALDVDPWSTDARISAWTDSLVNANPGFREMNVIKRFIARRGCERMARTYRRVRGAGLELARQSAGTPETPEIARARAAAGPPPVCRLGGHAVLRLVFLPHAIARDRWVLSVGFVTSYRAEEIYRLPLEPGFAVWCDRFGQWQERALAEMEP